MTKEAMLEILVVLEEKNLFLINNIQDDEIGLDNLKKNAKSQIKMWEDKDSTVVSNVDSMKRQYD